MTRLLIVDDEPLAVDSLYAVLQEKTTDIEIYKAYSGAEALDCLEKIKIDILLSDIRMPGMSGLELADKLKERWPRCKVIFLTGFKDFEYAQQAIRTGGYDYVLKTEGDDRIIGALMKAVADIRSEWRNIRLLEQARDNFHRALPLLKRDFFIEIISRKVSLASIARKFNDLEIPLHPDCEVMLGIGRIDRWPESIPSHDKPLLMYSMHNIADELFLPRTNIQFIALDETRFLWLFQPQNPVSPPPAALVKSVSRFVQGTSETFQSVCKELLKVSVSIVLDPKLHRLDQLEQPFQALNTVMSYGLGTGEEMLLLAENPVEANRYEEESARTKYEAVRINHNIYELLETHFEARQKVELLALLDHIDDWGRQQTGAKSPSYVLIEVFMRLSSLFLSWINRFGTDAELAQKLDIEKMLKLEKHHSWSEMIDFFKHLAAQLSDYSDREQAHRTDRIIREIQSFVIQNIHRDLPMTEIAEKFFMNPSYLSRLYKQRTGKGLLEFVNESKVQKAMELLRDPQMKIHEIATHVGLDSAGYFTRLFKKYTNMTPQQYRQLQSTM